MNEGVGDELAHGYGRRVELRDDVTGRALNDPVAAVAGDPFDGLVEHGGYRAREGGGVERSHRRGVVGLYCGADRAVWQVLLWVLAKGE